MEAPNNIAGLVNQLDDNLDDLEEALNPLQESAPSEFASKLPLLDRAKFYILTTYAIESALFCPSISLSTYRTRLLTSMYSVP